MFLLCSVIVNRNSIELNKVYIIIIIIITIIIIIIIINLFPSSVTSRDKTQLSLFFTLDVDFQCSFKLTSQ